MGEVVGSSESESWKEEVECGSEVKEGERDRVREAAERRVEELSRSEGLLGEGEGREG